MSGHLDGASLVLSCIYSPALEANGCVMLYRWTDGITRGTHMVYFHVSSLA